MPQFEVWRGVLMDFMTGLSHHVGLENAWSQENISATLGIKARDVRRMVRYMILELGWSICSSHRNAELGGYFLPRNPEEAQDACRSLHKQALALLKRESTLRKITLADLWGQMALEMSAPGELESLTADLEAA